jgi:hypothetical protein
MFFNETEIFPHMLPMPVFYKIDENHMLGVDNEYRVCEWLL